MRSRIAQALFTYRLTPQSTTGISPGELLLGQCPRLRLDLLKPHTAERVESSQLKQKEQHNRRSRERKLDVGENVFVRNYHGGDKWLPGVIEQRTGPVSFRVKLTDGRDRHCHQDQLRKRSVEVPQNSESEPEVIVPSPVITVPPTDPPDSPNSSTEPNVEEPISPTPSTDDTVVDSNPTEKIYPKRNRAPVIRFKPRVCCCVFILCFVVLLYCFCFVIPSI